MRKKGVKDLGPGWSAAQAALATKQNCPDSVPTFHHLYTEERQ